MSAPASKSNNSPFRHDLCVRLLPLARLKPFPRQIRSYPVTHIRKLAQSIDRFGWVIPIVTDSQDRVVAGWALMLAAQRLGLTEVPAVTVTELSNEELRGLRIALNRLSEDSAWDKQELSFELKELIDLGFEIDLTGFETAEIDLIIEEYGDWPRRRTRTPRTPFPRQIGISRR